ncbi:MAG: outer membrane protein G [Psychroserpens sp.]|jgi:outer membrane protein G
MKKGVVFLAFVLGATFANGQAFEGKGDSKFQVGANFQDNGTGIVTTYDAGLGENFSVGFTATYILGVGETTPEFDPKFDDRVDVRARFNANLGSVFQLGNQVDVYPGLSLGLRNFGGHLGTRYFFTDGFGLFMEFAVPLAKYDNSDLSAEQELNNQFVFSIGASFNL